MSLTGGDMCPVLAKAAEQARIPSSCGMFVYRDETSNVPMIAVRGSGFLFLPVSAENLGCRGCTMGPWEQGV